MSITYEPQMDAPPMLVTAIESANSEQLDTLWSILKYNSEKSVSYLMKVCALLGL